MRGCADKIVAMLENNNAVSKSRAMVGVFGGRAKSQGKRERKREKEEDWVVVDGGCDGTEGRRCFGQGSYEKKNRGGWEAKTPPPRSSIEWFDDGFDEVSGYHGEWLGSVSILPGEEVTE